MTRIFVLILASSLSVNDLVANDVGGSGKIKIISNFEETGLLWRWIQSKFEVSKFLKS